MRFFKFQFRVTTKNLQQLSEPTLRSFSRHENKTSAFHARPCYVRTALVRAMERIKVKLHYAYKVRNLVRCIPSSTLKLIRCCVNIDVNVVTR